MKALLIKNITREGPGLLENLLTSHSIAFDLIDLNQGEKIPPLFSYDAIFVFGGPDSANDQTAKMSRELACVKEVLDHQIPYLGICLGMQILAKAAGGEVVSNDVKEIGWRDPDGNFFQIELTDQGKDDPLFAGLSSPLKIFHLHGETVLPIADSTLLTIGKFCHVQDVRVGLSAYGLQGHFELTQYMFATWLDQDPDLSKLSRQDLQKDYQQIKAEYELTGTTLFTNFLKAAKLINRV